MQDNEDNKNNINNNHQNPPTDTNLPQTEKRTEAPPVYTGPTSGRRPNPYTTGPRPRHPAAPGGESHRQRPQPGAVVRRPLPDGYKKHRPPSSNPPARRPHPGQQLEDKPQEEMMTGPIGRRPDGKRPVRRARRKTQLAAVYIFIIVIVVGISLTAFAMAYQRHFDPERQAYVAATPTPTPTPTPLPQNTQNITGMITGMSGQSINMLNISNNQSRAFSLTEATSLNDRYGREMELDLLSVGHILNTYYDPDTNQLLRLRQTFTRNITPADFRVDTEYSTITVGNDVFNITEETLILHRGLPFELSEISPDDTVTLVILDGTVWLIDVAYGHGFLQFTNAEDILDGRVIMEHLALGTRNFGNLEDRIPLTEGTYRVTVEGRNIDPYVTEIEILQGETTTIDLDDVQPSAAVLELTVSPHGSRVYINDELTSIHAALEFEFGESISIRVERDGYYTDERTVEMNQAVVSIHVTLEEETPEVIMGNLFIFSMPAGAQIWINNQFVGTAPLSVDLYPGGYNIMAIAYGFHDYIVDINVQEGENTITVFMEPIIEEPPDEYIPIPTPPPDYYWPPPYDPPGDEPPYYSPPPDYGEHHGYDY